MKVWFTFDFLVTYLWTRVVHIVLAVTELAVSRAMLNPLPFCLVTDADVSTSGSSGERSSAT